MKDVNKEKRKLLYIHGEFSSFWRDSLKIKSLEKQFDVVGFDYDMEKSFLANRDEMVSFCVENKVDCVIGTSLGCLYAAEISEKLSLASILVNPCVKPFEVLSRAVGTRRNHSTGKEETLTQELVDTYPKTITLNLLCMVYLELCVTNIDYRKHLGVFAEASSVVYSWNDESGWGDLEQNDLFREHFEDFGRKRYGLKSLMKGED